jgi:hypothetical protein
MSWQDDGSGKVVVNGAEVRHSADSGKGNAVWSQGGTGYWHLDVEGTSGLWIGVTTGDNFAAGYGLKGLFYGGPGNLSDGNSLVTGHWGPKFGNGDRIGMRLEQNGDRASLAFSLNGTGLGVAFDIQGWSGGQLRPAVSLEDPSHAVKISDGGALPALESMLAAGGPGAGVEGSWRGRCDVQVERAGEDTWRVTAKVANSMTCTVARAGDGVKVVGHVISTKGCHSNNYRYFFLRIVLLPSVNCLRNNESIFLFLRKDEPKPNFQFFSTTIHP